QLRRELRLVAERTLLVCDGKRLIDDALCFVNPAELSERVTLSQIRHHGKIQLLDFGASFQRTVVGCQGLLGPPELHIAMSEESQPAYLRRNIPIRFRGFQRLSKLDDARADVAAEVRDDSEFSKRAVRPRIVAQPLREIQSLSPRLLGEHWIEILV